MPDIPAFENATLPNDIRAIDDPRIVNALEIAWRYGQIDGEHHKTWVIDQMVRALLQCPLQKATAVDAHGVQYTFEEQGESGGYRSFVAARSAGEDGPETCPWRVGIAP